MKMIVNKMLKLNKKALLNNDVPVSCIITKNNKIISSGYNQKNKLKDPLAHAEIIAIKKAAKKLKTYNLNDCELYITLFPCPMCEAVINEARIKKVYYILDKQKNVNNTIKYEKMFVQNENIFERELIDFFSDKR